MWILFSFFMSQYFSYNIKKNYALYNKYRAWYEVKKNNDEKKTATTAAKSRANKSWMSTNNVLWNWILKIGSKSIKMSKQILKRILHKLKSEVSYTHATHYHCFWIVIFALFYSKNRRVTCCHYLRIVSSPCFIAETGKPFVTTKFLNSNFFHI